MSNVRVTCETHSEGETEALGRALAQMLPVSAVVALHGELASGKTCFARGAASELAPGAHVHSPTFTLINEYSGNRPVYHMDFYRLEHPGEVADLGCTDLFDAPGVCLIEWADRAASLLPTRRVDVFFEHVGDDRREITIEDYGLLAPGWREALGRRG